jgi:sugar fermentation stimulation protein A
MPVRQRKEIQEVLRAVEFRTITGRRQPTRRLPADKGNREYFVRARQDSGIYIAIFHLARPIRIEVGSLGIHCFPPGIYFYVGSAQRNLAARLSRHAKRRKPLRWHIDYLSTKAGMLGAIVVPGARNQECRLAGELREHFRLAVPDFGSTDCGCGGHLFHSANL